MKITDGQNTNPLSQSLECLSKNHYDDQKKFQFKAISLYLNERFSDWLLKNVDPEFIEN